MTTASVEVRAEDRSVHISVRGEIDLANAAAVQDEIFAAITNQPTTVSVDLTDLTYVDSAGLRILFALADRLQLLQIALELVVPLGSPARRVIELSGLESFAPLRPEATHRLSDTQHGSANRTSPRDA